MAIQAPYRQASKGRGHLTAALCPCPAPAMRQAALLALLLPWQKIRATYPCIPTWTPSALGPDCIVYSHLIHVLAVIDLPHPCPSPCRLQQLLTGPTRNLLAPCGPFILLLPFTFSPFTPMLLTSQCVCLHTLTFDNLGWPLVDTVACVTTIQQYSVIHVAFRTLLLLTQEPWSCTAS